jgi:hypothetical protein
LLWADAHIGTLEQMHCCFGVRSLAWHAMTLLLKALMAVEMSIMLSSVSLVVNSHAENQM